MSCFKVVVLQKLFILEVAELGLNCIQLISQGQVVFVALLDLKNLSFQLTNEKVFLIRSQMHTVVVLKHSVIKQKVFD